MTKRDWRAIDAAIAEHLFGLDANRREVACIRERGTNNVPETRIYDYAARPFGVVNPARVTMWVVPGGPGDYEELPRYSSSWSGMGEVVEAMREKGYSLHIEIFAGMEGIIKAKAHFADSKGMGLERAGTAPRAVALACLAALGVEVPA